ncbi:hypothetical protein [Paraflavitalea pollutisoli]|uniref:hypothetical protein n=1 Tax=Paraflavitalea pollutisoli TaxID=3034143 RepID=UPI0023ED075B|nr:hypothetical protein [Paraflavitalea sp. H1-2-19X]
MMQQKRYNIFNQVHKALRSMLYDAADRLQQTDFDNRDDATEMVYDLEKILCYFEKHADHENTFILPAVARYDGALVERFQEGQITAEVLTESLRNTISAWEQTDDRAAMIGWGRYLLLTFNDFIAFNLSQMNKEEDELNEVLWVYYTDLELLQIRQMLIDTIPPGDLYEQSRWMVAASSNQELLGWLNGLRRKGQQTLYEIQLRLAEEVLPAKRWHLLRHALSPRVDEMTCPVV